MAHLNYENRLKIQKVLTENYSFKAIGVVIFLNLHIFVIVATKKANVLWKNVYDTLIVVHFLGNFYLENSLLF